MEKTQRESFFWSTEVRAQARAVIRPWAQPRLFLESKIFLEGSLYLVLSTPFPPRWSGGSKTPYAGEPPPDHPWGMATLSTRHLGGVLEAPGSVLEASWRRLGGVWRHLGGSWRRLGAVLEALGGVLEAFEGVLEALRGQSAAR